MKRDHTFTFELDLELELEVDYSYSYKPARTNCRNDDAHDAEEDSEISMSGNWQDQIRSAFLAEAENAIRGMQDKLSDLEFDNMPRKWAAEDAEEDYYEEAA